MATPYFVPGQRWISDTEANLGLGIVVEIRTRQVVFSFPAAGERRTYAIDNAPVSRVCYDVGDEIVSLDEVRIRVTAVEESEGCLVYSGVDAQGGEQTFAEIEISPFVQFSTPQARLFAGQIDRYQRFELRCDTLEQLRRHQLSSVSGLLGARVQLLPHQLYIAHEVSGRFAPRVLLADEVGLGKTIEAGLILHQQLISGRAERVLILVPEHLVYQWLVEMLRRFNLHFTILDEEDEGTDNPFEKAQLLLCPLTLLVDNPVMQQQAAACDWDLLLVDEAHHLEWSEQQASPAYLCVEQLAVIAKGLLLLTATPEQLGVESHFARLRLLDPDRYHSLKRFKSEEAGYQQINVLVEELLQWADTVPTAPQWPAHLRQLLDNLKPLLGEELLEPLRNIAAGPITDAPLRDVVEPLIDALLDRHGTGRVLFRNTRDNVKGFPERELVAHPLPLAESDAALWRQQVDVETLLTPELLFGADWVTRDSRVAWLSGWLRSHPGLKVLLICARADTAVVLEQHLRQREGFQSAVFHERMDLIARDRAAAYFADGEEGAQLLVCSEIGSEGRNFQFAHHLVLFDLPLNPDLLEQRIGRLDRIGQRERVTIHVPYYPDSPQQLLLDWYQRGLNAFEQTSAVGQAVFQQLRQELYAALREGIAGEELIRIAAQLRESLQLKMQQGRDRLLELNSCRTERAQAILSAIKEQERGEELFRYMARIFEQFGVDHEHHSRDSLVLHPGDHMLCTSFPGLPEGGVTVTHNRQLALAREDMQFLTWEHPMVTGAMDMVLNENFGNTAVCTLKLAPLKAGTLLLETVFTLHCPAPPALQLSRYLPLTWLRLLCDSDGRDLTGILTPERLNDRVAGINRATARQLVRQAQPRVEEMLAEAQRQAEQGQQQLVQDAVTKMRAEQNAELQRLQALARINPNIRSEEVALLQEQTLGLAEHLGNARFTLDALRVIIAI